MNIHYLEIVCEDVDAQCAALEALHGVSFGEARPELGQARTAIASDGTMIGVRGPLAPGDMLITRTYVEVADIAKAVADAEAAGGMLAYPPTEQGDSGTWAIYIHGGVQMGLWQK